jgi:Holliday junction DNA helicase RuvA
MIAHITGTLLSKNPESAIIDTTGVGYQLFVPLSTFYKLPDELEKVSLFVYTHVRENSFQLFGFQTKIEKKIFLLLISVSGIGPKLALNILSGIGPDDLLNAIITSNSERISDVPGVGKKTAQRITLELKEKASSLSIDIEPLPRNTFQVENKEIFDDALSALINLGYHSKPAKKAIEDILRINKEMNLEELLRVVLQNLSK